MPAVTYLDRNEWLRRYWRNMEAAYREESRRQRYEEEQQRLAEREMRVTCKHTRFVPIGPLAQRFAKRNRWYRCTRCRFSFRILPAPRTPPRWANFDKELRTAKVENVALGTVHDSHCLFLQAVKSSVGIECTHGHDVCPICDPCTCIGRTRRVPER